MPATRSDFRIEILCPDSSSELRLERGVAQERLGTLFEINLSLYSTDKEIELASVLGKPMAVHVKTATDERFFHGIVSHFSMVGVSEQFGHYQVVLRPKLWLLGETLCSRVFTGQSIADLVKKTLQRGAVDFGTVASSPAVTFDHCVQYRESDLHFFARLLERFGLYYFHKHEQAKHTLEVVSSLGDHEDVGTFAHAFDAGANEETQITSWRIASSLRTSSYRVEGTENLTRSSVDAKAKSRFDVAGASSLVANDFEAVDEQQKPWLEELAKARMQAIDASVEEFSGTCRSPKLAVGSLFTMEGHPRKEQNRQYLIVAAAYQFDGDMPGSPPSQDPYVVAFSAIDSKTAFSPPVVSRRPNVQGPHLATVVDETDEYGRVKVRFHWGNPDESTESMYARVSQNWAGKDYGGVFLPHIGHEVIVEFLDGDPNQPIVTGRVYNSENMPPLSLPGDKDKTIIKDHGGNHIMMDAAAKQMHIYCPSHESQIWLGKSIELSSVSNLVNNFLGYKKETIKGKSTTIIGDDHSETVGGNKDEHIIGKCSIKVGADVNEWFLGARHRNIVGLSSLFIGGMKKEHIVGAEWKRIDGLKREMIKGAKISQGKSTEFATWPDAKRTVKDAAIDAIKLWKINCKERREEAEKIVAKFKDKQEKTEKGEIEIKKVRYTGEIHRHLPTDAFSVGAPKIVLEGGKVTIDGDEITIGGNAMAIKP